MVLTAANQNYFGVKIDYCLTTREPIAVDKEFTNWVPSLGMRELWGRLTKEVPDAEALLMATVKQIVKLDADAWLEMSLPENEYRRDNYLIRYGLPLAELFGWPQNNSTLAEGLAVHFFWAVSWRHLDNVLDSNVVDQAEVGKIAVALCRAMKAQTESERHLGIAPSHEVSNLLQLLCATAKEERRAPIALQNIWQRAAPFLVVPRTLLRLSPELEDIYKAYINVDGLAHDIHDLMSDQKLGIQSLPISWFEALDADFAFRRDVVNAWFDKAEHELENAIEHLRQQPSVNCLRVLSFFIREAEEIKASLGAYSLPIARTTC